MSAEGAEQTAEVIALEGVTMDFSTRAGAMRVLGPVDIEVGREKFVALVGPSGCGKSTILNMIAGLLKPSVGRVLYDGVGVDGPNRAVGYMAQKDTLLPWRTVEDNIGIALELRCRFVTPSERRRRVAELVELVGLAGFSGHYPSELSGGMRKRAALARMLIYEPETLLLDEPFGALDAQLKLIMQQELLRLTQLRRMTVVFVTHDLAEAITLADTVLVFTARPGRIRAAREIPLPRPRDAQQIRFTPEFGNLHEDLWQELKAEVDAREEA